MDNVVSYSIFQEWESYFANETDRWNWVDRPYDLCERYLHGKQFLL
jgi:hypothetical protein